MPDRATEGIAEQGMAIFTIALCSSLLVVDSGQAILITTVLNMHCRTRAYRRRNMTVPYPDQ